ncbi:flavin reductase family protein [Halorubellus sp. JP-L1]|uniref:flavin reductase family protein n=1 Tax=Halorubellus sp. JP-L1 TaxID=2715753 RepID=UPI00140942F2|nr:flavin reductase family protein [Halorubellus sp. JP-L1]NHN42801.1 flavin reductase family protein [Halorubellus sp. JP-L1]
MELDPREREHAMHHIVTSLVTPRPIGWISTRNDDRDNLAPYSYFTLVNTYPPVVMFSASRNEDDTSKDSPRNAVESGEFVVNAVTEDLAEAMDLTSAPLGDVSEFDYFDIERAPSSTVAPPRVADAVANLECSVIDTMEVYDSDLVFGEVRHISVDERITTNETVDATKVRSVGRLGGAHYTGVSLLDVKRHGFGEWEAPVPLGFEVDDETGWISVDEPEFEAVRTALERVVDGEDPAVLEASGPFDEGELSGAVDRTELYLEGVTDDERLEAALTAAGYETTFSY